MAKIDEDEVKRVSAALNRHKHAPRLGPPTSKILTKNKAEAEKIFTSYFAKTGLPAGKLKELAAKNQVERQKLDGARLAAATVTLPPSSMSTRRLSSTAYARFSPTTAS